MKLKVKFVIGLAVISMVAGGAALISTKKYQATYAASELAPETGETYYGHPQLKGNFGGIDYLYSDHFFEIPVDQYDKHNATMSMNLVRAATTYINNGDYSDGARNIKQMYKEIGFENELINDGYLAKPTKDSIGFIIAEKDIHLNLTNKDVTAIMVTVRSANYEAEWASNVRLGDKGEALGFATAADEVTRYVNAYVLVNGLEEKAKDGNLTFMVQGFSRGGAVANLTAKRLIDKYQPDGNDVRAYCFEAPQGGVKMEEVEGRDYTGIHNVINVNDLVPYVAPSAMGFKRYGVDHYLFGDDINVEYVTAKQFPNNIAENIAQNAPTKKQLEAFNKQLKQITTNIEDNKFVEMTNYKLSLQVDNFGIVKNNNGESTSAFLKRFMDRITLNVDRYEFAKQGLEDALANIMVYLNRPNKMGTFTDEFSALDIADCIAAAIVPLVVELGIVEIRDIGSAIIEAITGNVKDDYQMTSGVRSILAGIVANKVSDSQAIADDMESNYPGGMSQALIDVKNLVYYALGGVGTVNDAITLGYNITDIFKNHSMLQTLAWLRSEDNWVEDSLLEPMW